MTGFEGSFLGAVSKISAGAVMECKICWTPYDPALGDPSRQVLPGTPFRDLPDDWKCPECDGARDQFMVLRDSGTDDAARQADIARRTALLEAEFTEIYNSRMRDVPINNQALHVQAVGFTAHQGCLLGVLISPWFMNLVLLPEQEGDWDELQPLAKETVAFASGDYEFIHNRREMVGGYKACSLFSPMADFTSQLQAVEVAKAVLAALHDGANRAETDRAAEIRAAREADLAPAGLPQTGEAAAATRRAVISAGLAGPAAEA